MLSIGAQSQRRLSKLLQAFVSIPGVVNTCPALVVAALVFLQDTTFGKVLDLALGVAIPVHSHIAINSVLSDYVPKSVLGKSPFSVDPWRNWQFCMHMTEEGGYLMLS